MSHYKQKRGNRGRGEGGRQMPKSKKGFLPEETMSSFRRIADELKQLNLDDEDEKSLFLNATVGFMSEDYVHISQNQTVSMIIESVIAICPSWNLRTLFVAAIKDLSVAFLDRFASHVFESLLQRLPTYYQVSDKSADQEDVDQVNFEKSFQSLCDFVDSNFEILVTHTYGSHVLRALLEGLSGIPVAHEVKKSPPAHHGHSLKGVCKSLQKVTSSQNLQSLFDKYIRRLFRECDYDVHLKDSLFSVLLQAALLILHQLDDDRCQSRCRKILKRVIKSGSDDNSTESLPHVIQDSSGSHLLEVIMKVGSGDLLQRAYDSLLCHKVVLYAVHPYANHLLKSFISAVTDKDLFQKLFDEMAITLEDVLAVGFLQLIAELAKACRRLGTRQDEILKSLMAAFHCNDPPERQKSLFKLVTSFLTYEKFYELKEDGSGDPNNKNPVLKKPVNLAGSLLLQELLQFDKPKHVTLGLLDLSPQEIMTLCCDPAGSRIIDAFFSSPTILDKKKDKLLALLNGLLVEIACSRNGSRCLESAWSNLTTQQRTLVAKELSASERVRGDQYGHFLYYNFELGNFFTQQNRWLQHQSTEVKKKLALKQLLIDSSAKAKKRKIHTESKDL